MSQADLIRAHAQKRYVEVARRARQKTVTIVAGEVGRDLGLSGRMPNICQVLQGRKFLEMAGVRLLNIEGPEASTSTRFHYEIENISPSSGGELQLEPIRASHSRPSPRRTPTKATNERDRSPSPLLRALSSFSARRVRTTRRVRTRTPDASRRQMANPSSLSRIPQSRRNNPRSSIGGPTISRHRGCHGGTSWLSTIRPTATTAPIRVASCLLGVCTKTPPTGTWSTN